ncbi:MAG: hypothetical protein DMF38_07125 [Verrucomicrobia bacterium]|nr:MAG: hypothetical protein DME78_05000 [Verrucomicrobiota bacterium]PYL34789.1 MAG: hypothetical protein DMF38_07125 [Verrucomicrobiota bacterium]
MLRLARGIASKLYLRLPQSAIQKIIAALRGALLADFASNDRQVSDVARQICSHNRHGNVTIFLRGRHLFVTPGCNGARKPKRNYETSTIGTRR